MGVVPASHRLSFLLSERLIETGMGEQKIRRLFLDFEVDGKRLYPAILGPESTTSRHSGSIRERPEPPQ